MITVINLGNFETKGLVGDAWASIQIVFLEAETKGGNVCVDFTQATPTGVVADIPMAMGQGTRYLYGCT